MSDNKSVFVIFSDYSNSSQVEGIYEDGYHAEKIRDYFNYDRVEEVPLTPVPLDTLKDLGGLSSWAVYWWRHLRKEPFQVQRVSNAFDTIDQLQVSTHVDDVSGWPVWCRLLAKDSVDAVERLKKRIETVEVGDASIFGTRERIYTIRDGKVVPLYKTSPQMYQHPRMRTVVGYEGGSFKFTLEQKD